MKDRILDIINPDNPYSQEDFNREFSSQFDLGSNKIDFKFINTSNNPNPEYATNGSSGFDLRAFLPEPITMSVGQFIVVPTGLFFETPNNFEIQIRPRSGLAAKNGVTVLNTPGTIDSDYRGEIKVILINLGNEPFTINSGDRIAQAIIASVLNKNVIELNQVTAIDLLTDRGSGGLGSTGVS
jgi:dUTP pyrophosphatase